MADTKAVSCENGSMAIALRWIKRTVGTILAVIGIGEVFELTTLKAILDTFGRVLAVGEVAKWLLERFLHHPWGIAFLVVGLALLWPDLRRKKAIVPIKELKDKPLVDRSLDLLFYPRADNVGRHIQAAAWGSAEKPPAIITLHIEKLFRNGRVEVPVNNDELGVGLEGDPDRGNPSKFLTITYTETLKEGDILKLPFRWLGTQKLRLNITAQVAGDFNELTWPQRITLWKILTTPAIGELSLIHFLEAKNFASPHEIVKAVCDTTLLDQDGYGRLSVKVAVAGMVTHLFLLNPLSGDFT